MRFQYPAHDLIADLLSQLNHELLLNNSCWFGGGTAIVLKFGEYRRSLDIDFLCATGDGYRELRNAVFERGAGVLFPHGITQRRDIRADAYGIRTVLEYRKQAFKFEIIREARIELEGLYDQELEVPLLAVNDMFAEKLLANADRCMDRSASYRDALDIGMLVKANGQIPDSGLQKAIEAYGADIQRKAIWVVNRLTDEDELRQAAQSVFMEFDKAADAIALLRQECRRLWPQAQIV